MKNENTVCSHVQSKGLPKQGVPGCIRNFKMNGALMTSPSVNRGAGPCLVGRTQKGAYFAGNRAHVIVSKYSQKHTHNISKYWDEFQGHIQ